MAPGSIAREARRSRLVDPMHLQRVAGEAQADAIVVGTESIVEFAGVEKVWKVVDGMAKEQVVQTGQRREGGVQITEGLAAGDTILRNGRQGRAARIIAKLPTAEKMTVSKTAAHDHKEEEDTSVAPSTE